ncbi:MAG: hypothetical protein CVU05_11980 [Bacteroidetes bacterium HGW-Bacteroidetes-21]|nr:MAG: hypothetical protein CVU05_11980 [Bacteroidetes bacterium HGW-Bacteroidetes-21]
MKILMKTNRFLILLLICLPFLVSGQGLEMNSKKVDFKQINEVIKDKTSPYFYDLIMKKFLSEKETLTPEEYWYLYYGYSFQAKYMPYQSPERMEEFNKITAKKELDEKDYKKIITYTEKELKNLPLELDMIWYQHVAWKELGDSVKADNAINHFMGLVDAILSSGDGMTCETGFIVLYISHEYVLLNVLGFDFDGKQILTEDLCDKLKLGSNEQQITSLYFNVNRIFEVNLKKIED